MVETQFTEWSSIAAIWLLATVLGRSDSDCNKPESHRLSMFICRLIRISQNETINHEDDPCISRYFTNPISVSSFCFFTEHLRPFFDPSESPKLTLCFLSYNQLHYHNSFCYKETDTIPTSPIIWIPDRPLHKQANG